MSYERKPYDLVPDALPWRDRNKEKNQLQTFATMLRAAASQTHGDWRPVFEKMCESVIIVAKEHSAADDGELLSIRVRVFGSEWIFTPSGALVHIQPALEPVEQLEAVLNADLKDGDAKL